MIGITTERLSTPRGWGIKNEGMETLFACIRYGAPLALVLMGAVISLRPPRSANWRAICAWIISFVIVGGSLTAVQVHTDTIDRNEREALEAELTGGNSFAYLRIRDAVSRDGGNFAEITTTGALPSLHLGFYPVLPGSDEYAIGSPMVNRATSSGSPSLGS